MAKKMDRSELRTLLSAQKTAAMAATQSSKLSRDRERSSQFYKGDVSADLPTIEGRSAAVSTDVSDTIEGLMPQLMEIFAGNDQVVEFNPVGPEDVDAAKQESDYVNHVFMNQNSGFLVLYSFIKDALLSKNGIVKVWWEERDEEETETYTDLTDDEFKILVSDSEVEITEHTEKPVEDPQLAMMTGTQATHDVTLSRKRTVGEAKVLGVPPEEFGIEKDARSISTSNYCFHTVVTTPAELIAKGYDRRQVRELPTWAGSQASTEQISRDTVDESQNTDAEKDDDSRPVEITEHYCKFDYEGKGEVCLYRVVTGGETEEILKLDGYDDITKFDVMPFAAMTPIIVPHRFFGISIADITMDIMKIKTALLRAMLDNAYLANNPRVEVAEAYASENTLDDLLVSRHGGIVRTKQPGGIQWQQIPTIGNHVYPLLEYMDFTREMRTGVSRQAQGIDAEALQNQSATAVAQLYSVAQAKVRLIARIFAETGIKDMFSLLHGTIRKHGQQVQTYRLLNKWVTVDPRQWKKRTDMTVHVGLGSGGKAEQIALTNMIAGYQAQAVAAGLSNLVGPQQLYSTGKDLALLANKKNVDAYFMDPSTQPALPPPPPDPKLQIEMMKLQAQDKKTQSDAAHQAWKLQADAALEQQKFEHDKEIALLEAELKAREQAHAQHIAERKAAVDEHVAMHKLEIEKAKAAMKAQSEASPKASIEVKHGASEITGPMGEAIERLGHHMTSHHERQNAMMTEFMRHISAPKRVVRDAKGKISHTESVL